MRELILQPGIRIEKMPLVAKNLYGPSSNVERIAVVLQDNSRSTAWLYTVYGVVEVPVAENHHLCHRFHISCALWFGIPKEEFEKCLREKLSEILQLVQLANYPSGYLSICVRAKDKECVGYTANNTYYEEDSKYPVDIHDLEWEDETGKNHIVK